MNQLTEIITVGLAAGYLAIAWRDGSIFASPRAWLQHDMLIEKARRYGDTVQWVAEKVSDLLLCPLCLSPYLCGIAWIYLWLQSIDMPIVWAAISNFASACISWAVYRTFNTRSMEHQ